jgi:hypothetical protein
VLLLSVETDKLRHTKRKRTSGVLPGLFPNKNTQSVVFVMSSMYKEKIWVKKEGGEDVTDGYIYRGKKAFDKALGGLKGTLKKGFQRSLNGVDFRVLDTRIKGVELEIEVEIIENKNKGVAVLKLYGPNKKKENVLTVSRCKGNDKNK